MSQATQRVGQYNFLKKLGAGRMAEVFLGRIEGAEGFQKPVAIKKILPELATDLQFVQSLIAEAKVGGQLHHRNIVEVYDFIRYGNDYCIIMEYVDGVDLSRILRSAKRYRVRIPPAAALYIASQVCDGLDYAHSARGFNGEPLNIIHRDLKPSNILISIKGGVKISDFGIARVMDQAIQRLAGSAVRPSFQYQSPEQSTGSMRLTSASDIFSVGVILFEMLTLEPLFNGKTPLETFEGMRESELARRLSLAQRQLPGSEKILATALNPNPADRYRSAALMAEDLRRLLVYMKVDDPRERLVTFFQRLVRFVQEQGKRPAEGQAAQEEDWEVETRVGSGDSLNTRGAGVGAPGQSDGEGESGGAAWESGAEDGMASSAGGLSSEPEMAAYQEQNAWGPGGGESTSPRPKASEAFGTLPPGHRDDVTGGLPWGHRPETVGGSYGGLEVPPEETPLRPVREETRVGTYETVERAYAETANLPRAGAYGPTLNLAPPDGAYGVTAPVPPPQHPLDSTRILPVGDPPPPPPVHGYVPADPRPQPEWPAEEIGNGTQLLPAPQFEAEAPIRRRSRLPLMIIGLVGMLALGGGGLAVWNHMNSPGDAAAQNGPSSLHEVACPTCGRQVPCAPYCPFCGTELNCAAPLAPNEVQCPHCGAVNEKDAKFCGSCGKPLHEHDTPTQ